MHDARTNDDPDPMFAPRSGEARAAPAAVVQTPLCYQSSILLVQSFDMMNPASFPHFNGQFCSFIAYGSFHFKATKDKISAPSVEYSCSLKVIFSVTLIPVTFYRRNLVWLQYSMSTQTSTKGHVLSFVNLKWNDPYLCRCR